MSIRHLSCCPTEQKDYEEKDCIFDRRKSHERLQIPVYVEHLGIYPENMNNNFVDCQFLILIKVKKRLLGQRGQLLRSASKGLGCLEGKRSLGRKGLDRNRHFLLV
jgi:hypothetical protein